MFSIESKAQTFKSFFWVAEDFVERATDQSTVDSDTLLPEPLISVDDMRSFVKTQTVLGIHSPCHSALNVIIESLEKTINTNKLYLETIDQLDDSDSNYNLFQLLYFEVIYRLFGIRLYRLQNDKSHSELASYYKLFYDLVTSIKGVNADFKHELYLGVSDSLSEIAVQYPINLYM